MTIRDYLDNFIEEAVVGLYPPEVSAVILCSEDVCLNGVELKEELKKELFEAIKRFKVKVAGGGYITKRRIGRKDPRRAMAAKRGARKGRAARMRAMRNPRSKMKRKRTLAARKRLMGTRRKSNVRRPSRRR